MLFKMLMLFLLFYFINALNNYSISNEIVFKNIKLNQTNHLFLTGEINNDLKKIFIEGTKNIEGNNIYIYINSNGGCVFEGNNIINYIKYLDNSGKNIYCIAQNAFSMAFYIFQNCPNRYITESSILMQHQMTIGSMDKYENLKSYFKLMDSINNNFINYMAKKISISKDDYKKKILSDWWIYGSDIINNHLADDIVTIGCDIKLFNYYILKNFSTYGSLCPLLHN